MSKMIERITTRRVVVIYEFTLDEIKEWVSKNIARSQSTNVECYNLSSKNDIKFIFTFEDPLYYINIKLIDIFKKIMSFDDDICYEVYVNDIRSIIPEKYYLKIIINESDECD